MKTKTTRRAAMTLAVMMLTTLTAWADYNGGSGTKDNPFRIASASDLATLCTNVNNGTNYENTYFEQTDNITLSSAWTPIGQSESTPFKGHYNGAGYKISGLTITASGTYTGLFGYVRGGNYNGSEANTHIAEVHNVVLENPSVTVTASSDTQYAGAVAGIGGECSRIYDCTVIGGTVSYTGGSNYNTNDSYAGGLVGIYSPSNFARLSGNKVSGTTVSGGGICGGLVGFIQMSDRISNNNIVDANISSAEYKYNPPSGSSITCHREGAVVGYCNTHTSTTVSGNYYHSATGLNAFGSYPTYDGTAHVVTVDDPTGYAHIYTVTSQTDGLTLSGDATYTIGTARYYVSGATATLTLTDADKAISTFTATGAAASSLSADKTTATVTIGTNDVTVTATLLTIGGTCGDGLTWRMSDENSDGTYDRLTLSGSGTLSTSPWDTDFAASISRVDVSSTDIAISGNPFSALASSVVIVVPTPAYAVSYASADYAAKLRVALGGQLFSATDEGGTPAYKIATADDLRHLAAAVNDGNNGYGKAFRQTADIDLTSGGNFTPIGNNGAIFVGTYDGGSHTISGLTVNGDDSTTGLFGYIEYGTVKNVILVSPSVTSTYDDDKAIDVGALAGYCGYATIENCHAVNPTVSATGTGSAKKILGALIGELYIGTTATNCYYYGGNQSNAMGQKHNTTTVTNVSAAHLVNHGTDVTIQTAMAANLGFTCDSDDDGTPENYWCTGAELTLGNTLGEAPEYYALNYATTAGTISGSTLTVGDQDATVSAAIRSDGQSHTVTYMNADGTTAQTSAIALDGYETLTYNNVQLAGGTYFVGTDISYANKIVPDGDITLILANGKTMTLATDNSGIEKIIDVTIYGQSLDPATAGTLRYDGKFGGMHVRNYTQHSGNVSLTSTPYTGARALVADNVTLRGGTLTVTANSDNAIAIKTDFSFTVTGGQLDATATGTGAVGIDANTKAITLGWTNADDRITASSYKGTLTLADAFIDEDGTLHTSSNVGTIDGKTLTPAVVLADAADNATAIAQAATACTGSKTLAVQLSGRTLYKDGAWNTLCLPFAVSTTSGPLAGDGVETKVLRKSDSRINGTTLDLYFDDAPEPIPAGTPFLIKWGDKDDPSTLVGLTDLVNPVFEAVTVTNADNEVASTDGSVKFVGSYSPVAFTAGDKTKLYLGAANKLYWPNADFSLGACRAYFDMGENSVVSAVKMNFEEEGQTSSLRPLTISPEGERTEAFPREGMDGVWFDLSGRKLSSKPTQKGVYIVNGKKVVIK